jgi:hypothetical protein
MEYEIDKTSRFLRLIPSTDAEREMLGQMEKELHQNYRRGEYTLSFSSKSVGAKPNSLESLSFKIKTKYKEMKFRGKFY